MNTILKQRFFPHDISNSCVLIGFLGTNKANIKITFIDADGKLLILEVEMYC